VVAGVRAGFPDSARFDLIDLATGSADPWATLDLAAFSGAHWLPDGSLLFIGFHADGLFKLYRVPRAGHVTVLGSIPRAAKAVDLSRDLKRAAITVREDRSDVWRWRVARR
jgi:hypothetical protein